METRKLLEGILGSMPVEAAIPADNKKINRMLQEISGYEPAFFNEIEFPSAQIPHCQKITDTLEDMEDEQLLLEIEGFYYISPELRNKEKASEFAESKIIGKFERVLRLERQHHNWSYEFHASYETAKKALLFKKLLGKTEEDEKSFLELMKLYIADWRKHGDKITKVSGGEDAGMPQIEVNIRDFKQRTYDFADKNHFNYICEHWDKIVEL